MDRMWFYSFLKVLKQIIMDDVVEVQEEPNFEEVYAVAKEWSKVEDVAGDDERILALRGGVERLLRSFSVQELCDLEKYLLVLCARDTDTEGEDPKAVIRVAERVSQLRELEFARRAEACLKEIINELFPGETMEFLSLPFYSKLWKSGDSSESTFGPGVIITIRNFGSIDVDKFWEAISETKGDVVMLGKTKSPMVRIIVPIILLLRKEMKEGKSYNDELEGGDNGFGDGETTEVIEGLRSSISGVLGEDDERMGDDPFDHSW